jgi:hypothetical protein
MSAKSPRSVSSTNGVIINLPPGSEFDESHVTLDPYDGNDLPRSNERLVSAAIEVGVQSPELSRISEDYVDGERTPLYQIRFPLTESNLKENELRVRVKLDNEGKLPIFWTLDKANNSYVAYTLGLADGWKMGVVQGSEVTPVRSAVTYSSELNKGNYTWNTFDFEVRDDSDKTNTADTLRTEDIQEYIVPIANDVLTKYFNAGYKSPNLDPFQNINAFQMVLIEKDVPGHPAIPGSSYYYPPGRGMPLGAVYIFYPSYITDRSKPSSWDLKFVIGHEIFHSIQSAYNYKTDYSNSAFFYGKPASVVTCYEEGTANLLGATYKRYGDVNSNRIELEQDVDFMRLCVPFDDFNYNPYAKQDFFGFIAKRYFSANLEHMDELWKALAASWPQQNYDYTKMLDYYRSGLNAFLVNHGYSLPWAFTEFALQRLIIHEPSMLLREDELQDARFVEFQFAKHLLCYPVNNSCSVNNYRLMESKVDTALDYTPVMIDNIRSFSAAGIDFALPPDLDEESRPDSLKFNISLTGGIKVEPDLDKEGMRIAGYRKKNGKLVTSEPSLLLNDIDRTVAISLEEDVDTISFVFVKATMARGSTKLTIGLQSEGSVLNATKDVRYTSIQEAVTEASDGDEILVDPGVYNEFVLVRSKSLSISSTGSSDDTFVDGEGIEAEYGMVILNDGSDDKEVSLSGITFRRWEVGLACAKTADGDLNVNIANNRFNTNKSSGMLVQDCHGFIQNNIIDENGSEADDEQALLLYGDENLEVSENMINNNKGGGIFINGSVLIKDNMIERNTKVNAGGGISVSAGSPLITRNTISRNEAGEGGGIHVWSATPIIENNTIEYNTTQWGKVGA